MRRQSLQNPDLGVTKSFSRPYVSDDNPFSESQFRTLQYRPDFPYRFGCVRDARAYGQVFFPWYNDEHRHSGLGMLTPKNVHYGEAESVLAQRKLVLDAAYAAHPSSVWINPPARTNSEEKSH